MHVLCLCSSSAAEPAADAEHEIPDLPEVETLNFELLFIEPGRSAPMSAEGVGQCHCKATHGKVTHGKELGEKDLDFLMDNKLSMSQQCALAAEEDHLICSCMRQSIASRSGEVTLYSALMRHIWRAVPRLRDMKQVKERARTMIKGLEHV
ncbi:hypothetical protein BTVI_159101 [Pitangus sulphuratus]|nr:hypothetical protein BTVI_159101 [Pitangus sulphuratus]